MPDSVLVVGGGTAGWMTATYLKAAFGERVSVTVVESPAVSTIGVGEATFSTVRHFFSSLGLAEHEWMSPCNATYKLGIRFRDWRAPGHDFYHPFERLSVVDGFTVADWWTSDGATGRFDRDLFLISALCDAERSPRRLDGSLFEDHPDGRTSTSFRSTLDDNGTQFPYAYHFDAQLLAGFLAGHGVGQGVQRVLTHVREVGRDERGWIDHITTDCGELRADLYIDCTGFRGLLINGALDEPFISYQDALPNDRAVALRVPVDMAKVGLNPYTTATAVDAGWIWTIPLYGRIGTGYVYASDYSTPERAEQDLRAFVGPPAKDLEANHIRMRIGRNRNSWVHNCVAIGLSSGFVEPLESTGIFLIQHGVEQLVKHWPDRQWDDGLRASYNRRVARCLDGVRDFLVFHYFGAARDDNAYWRDAKWRSLPDGVADRIDRWRTELPDTDNIYPHYHGFEPYSYVCMLLGLGRIASRPRPVLRMLASDRARREIRSIQQRARQLVETLPSHLDYLAQQRSLATSSINE